MNQGLGYICHCREEWFSIGNHILYIGKELNTILQKVNNIHESKRIRKEQKITTKTKNNKIAITTHLSLITLNTNGLNVQKING